MSDQATTESAPPPPPTWLFIGDFLFYLRLLARQFASLARAQGKARKNMVIVPETSMAWEQLAGGTTEAVIIDCVEATQTHLNFIRTVRAHYPQVRQVLVSAALNKKMEAELMEAGAHLCFSKPRTGEEAGSVYQLVEALTNSDGFYPNGSFKGLAPARFIQFLCARSETGRVAMDTEKGEAVLVMENGRIVDAKLGDLTGDSAAALILSLDRTNRCHFKHMQTSQFHTIKLHTHQLWLDSDKINAPPPPVPAELRVTPPSKKLSEVLSALDSMDKMSLHIQLEPPDASPNGAA